MPKISKQPIDLIFGFGGMHPDENDRAKYWATLFEPFMLLIAFWTLLEWHLSSKGLLSEHHSMLANWLIWGFFLIETLTLSILSDRPLRYIMRNWAHLVIIFLGIPLFYESANRVGILRMIRLLLLFGFITHNLHTLKHLLSQNHLGKTLLVGVVLILASGILIATIDPSICISSYPFWYWLSIPYHCKSICLPFIQRNTTGTTVRKSRIKKATRT